MFNRYSTWDDRFKLRDFPSTVAVLRLAKVLETNTQTVDYIQRQRYSQAD